ncbi:sodium/potassium-transporting ATPase subunit beta-1 [Biomphalaria glabrata]|uniref:Sodium/potassium-transporting ATPase subunit beta-1-like n=1 Tax=Biomphalaria glabrata TaxID=6526 RepID=A0A2C9JRG0_BIOGL|nr:sodium/potassium-transporting ATPase subunit beta-1-like [Biomphalaria glabrata]KAI8751037.1 sodium/potassium-transporting ATPase subunit beta-1-like [Biomphalaria glabrata]KAI8772349.1 sodium/potassium-transporting ATPase subunit beta-1 [Biomphalaria glabrata]
MASQVSGYSGTSSAFYQSTIQSTGIQRETIGDRLSQTKEWLYNSEEGTVMGRTPKDWFLYILCIFVFLAALLGISAAFCGVFYWVVDWNYPTLQGAHSILQTPGMSFRPQPDHKSTLIRFLKGDVTTYTHIIDHIEAYIQFYENTLQVGDRYQDCSEIRKRRTTDLDKACVFLPEVLGNLCVKQQNYGYDDGQPCILLKLNRIVDWVPEEYTADTVPDLLKDTWKEDDPWWIYVKCDGDDDASRENMGDLLYFPAPGFHFKYYPFRNQQGYRSPLVFLRMDNPRPGALLFITCRAFAKNIEHDKTENIGQVRFELLVD